MLVAALAIRSLSNSGDGAQGVEGEPARRGRVHGSRSYRLLEKVVLRQQIAWLANTQGRPRCVGPGTGGAELALIVVSSPP